MKYLYTLIPLLAQSCTMTANTAQIPINPHMTASSSQITKRDPPTCIVTALETLNLRESPGTDSAVIAVLMHGDRLTLLPDPAQGNWIHIQMTDRNGWVNSNYCQRITP